jgi:peptide/nickel transport system substrate-binding protein
MIGFTPGARGLIGGLVIAACLPACASCRRETASATPQGQLNVRLGIAVPPIGVPTAGVPELVKGLYGETLFFPDRNGSPQRRLCERWQWLEDGSVLEITLKKGVTFHDGTPLDAATAAKVLPERFAENRWSVSYRSVTRFEVVDDLTLRLHLNRPEAFLLDDLTDARITRGFIGTGPFAIEGTVTEQAARLHAYRAYHQGQPQVNTVDIRRYPSQRNAWAAMMRDEINVLYEVSREAAPFVEAENTVQSYPLLRSYVNALFFNVRHPVLSRREVRQALSYAIDRDAIVRDVMEGRGERADSPVWKYHWAYSTAQKTYDFNPDLARVKLDAAGFTEGRVGAAGGMPSRFRFTCLILGNDSRFERVALVLQKQLYDVGVDMRVEPVDFRQLLERFSSGKFDAVFTEAISGRSLTWLYRQWRSNPTHALGQLDSGYTAADATLDRLRETLKESEIKRLVGDLQRVFYEDPPAIFVAWPQTSRAVSADLTVPYEPNADVIGRIWRFHRAGEAIRP